MPLWEDIQRKIWSCEICRGHERAACNLRQQTEEPEREVTLLLVGIAPPFMKDISEKTQSKSATNNPDDRLRKFVLRTLGLSWEELKNRGLFFVHSVKCGIFPTNDKYKKQNPPIEIVNACSPLHLREELEFIRPPRIVAFGKEAVRGIFTGVVVEKIKGFGVSKTMKILSEKSKGGLALQADGWNFKLHVSPFPLNGVEEGKYGATILFEAAKASKVVGNGPCEPLPFGFRTEKAMSAKITKPH